MAGVVASAGDGGTHPGGGVAVEDGGGVYFSDVCLGFGCGVGRFDVDVT